MSKRTHKEGNGSVFSSGGEAEAWKNLHDHLQRLQLLMAVTGDSQRCDLSLSENNENESSASLETKTQKNFKAFSTKLVRSTASVPSQPSIIRVVTVGISSYVCILLRGARGAVEALIIDVKEVTWWLVRLCLSDQTFTRFHDQWQVFLSGASTSDEDEQLEKRRRHRARTFVRLLGSLIPLAPVQRPYLRFVSLNSLNTSDDSLFNGSVRSGSVRSLRMPSSKQQLQSKPVILEHNRPQLLRSEGTTNLSGYSNESGFSTAHYLDSDTSSCVDNDLLDDDTEGDHQSITSSYSMAASEAAGNSGVTAWLQVTVGLQHGCR
ncbi:hypothetical protein FHG87_004058 [Trinorchestia longiramus]|nr:hypothetical protein FHG87_004058 [Trinorchestia longiramus]